MAKVAVFARNYPNHLEEACELSRKDSNRFIPFKSSKSWARIQKSLKKHGSTRIYFATVGGDGSIEYYARLERVIIHPKAGDSEVEGLLRMGTSTTQGEGLDAMPGKPAATLYVISDCRRVDPAGSLLMTDLIKEGDRKPISPGYRYNYLPILDLEYLGQEFQRYPEELAFEEAYPEGAVKQVTVNAYERNPAARKACIAHYGCSCTVCGMNFEDRYGEVGSDFIHVHHLRMVSSVGRRYEVDPINDLRPVCPNCHAMLHRGTREPRSVEEMKQLMLAAAGASRR